MSLSTDLEAAKAEVTRIESEIAAALPSELLGKTETELASLYHAVLAFFKGTPPPVPDPVPDPVPEVTVPVESQDPAAEA